jgi:5-methylcytosine-specific restriction endonuclease McrA
MWLFGHKKLGFIPDVAVPDAVVENEPEGYKHFCVTCGDVFYTKGEAKFRKYCSYDCLLKVNNVEYRRVTYYRKCANPKCDNWIIAETKSGMYCDEQCSIKAHARSSADIFSAVDMEYYYEKYNFTCQICLEQFEPESLAPHHIIPVALGGDTNEDNTIILCHNCHGKQHTSEIWRQIRSNKANAKRLLFEQQQEYLKSPFYGLVLYRH